MADVAAQEERGKHQRGVMKGKKRGSYKRSQLKQETKDVQEDGLSIQEIAQIMGISALEVQNIETRALKKLRTPTDQNKGLRRYARV